MENVDKLFFQITPVWLLYLLYLLRCWCFCCCCGCCGHNEIKVTFDSSMGLRGACTIVRASNTSRTNTNLPSKSLYFLSSAALLVTLQSTIDNYGNDWYWLFEERKTHHFLNCKYLLLFHLSITCSQTTRSFEQIWFFNLKEIHCFNLTIIYLNEILKHFLLVK